MYSGYNWSKIDYDTMGFTQEIEKETYTTINYTLYVHKNHWFYMTGPNQRLESLKQWRQYFLTA